MLLRLFFIFSFFTAPIMSFAVPQAKSIQSRNQGHLIVIDPGHGGFDMGAVSHGLEEKTLALRTALLVKRYLTTMGYRVILTRSRDIFIPLEKRTAIANDTKSKIFVSLHYNAHRSTDAEGIEVYYFSKGSKWRSSSSKKLAQSVLSRLLHHTKAASRGIKHGNFHVIRETNMPAILVEGGFITHPKERANLNDRQYIDHIAQAIAEGVDKHFH